jgi:HD superfamily phosphohydrolase YqeK
MLIFDCSIHQGQFGKLWRINMSSIAHTKNPQGKRQGLEDHLRNVAVTAGQYCASFGGATFARYAGLIHDIGKFDPAFQQYLLNAEQNPGRGTAMGYGG